MNSGFRAGVLAGIILGAALGAGAVAVIRRTPPQAVHAPAPRAADPDTAALRDENERLKKRVAELESIPAAPAAPAFKDEPAPAAAPAPSLKEIFAKLAEKGLAALYDAENLAKAVEAAKVAGKAGIDFLADLLRNSRSANERILAAALLGATQDPSAVAALADALKNEKDLVVRRTAAQALAGMGAAGAEDPLRAAMLGDTDWGVRANAAYGVAKLGKEDGLRLLRQSYESAETPAEYRIFVLGGLADVASPSTAPLFRKILSDSRDEGYLLIAIGALEKMKDVEAIPALQRVATDDHPDSIQEAAQKAIEALRK